MSTSPERGPNSDRLQDPEKHNLSCEAPPKRGILKVLLASPLIGSELDIARPIEEGREVDL